MTRDTAHMVAVLACTAAAVAIIAGPPTAPLWVRWVGCALALPAILSFVATAPRSTRR